MTTKDKILIPNLAVGSKVYYQGIPNQQATIKAIGEGKAFLKYRGEKGRLIVPLSQCKIL